MGLPGYARQGRPPKHDEVDKKRALDLMDQLRKMEDIYGTPTLLAAMSQIHSEESYKQRERNHLIQAEEEFNTAVLLRAVAEKMKCAATANKTAAHPLDGTMPWTNGKKTNRF